MYWMNEIGLWLERISRQLHLQSVHLREMESAIKRLEDEMAAWKTKNQTHIDKVEYNFDQLKVEKLEGTLNIGLTPTEGVSGQDLQDQQGASDQQNLPGQQAQQNLQGQQSASGQGAPGQQAQQSAQGQQKPQGQQQPQGWIDDLSIGGIPTYSQFLDEMDRYMEQEVPGEIEQLEQRYHLAAGKEYSQSVIDDIRKQLEPRVRHYLKTWAGKAPVDAQGIVARLKRDVNEALRNYFERSAKEKGEDDH